MKIAICMRSGTELGGIGVYTRNLLDAMLKMESGNSWVLMYREREHLGAYAHLPRVKEVMVRAPSKFAWDQAAIPTRAFIERADVLFHPKLAVPLVSPFKTVMTVHGSERFVFPEFSERLDIIFFRTLYRLYLKRATAIISVSDNARRDLVRFAHINPKKITTVHLAASGKFRVIEDRAALEEVRRRYNLPERFLLNVGLIYPGKNIPNLLRALKAVRERHDVKLVIAGTGRRMYEQELDVANQLGLHEAVSLPGYIPHEDLVAVYNLAEMVVFPSYYESFPAIPLEANACGCPVVTSDTGGTPEAAGDAALYVSPTDVEGMARAIERVLTDPALRADLVRKGFENVKRFSWEKTARETLAVFASLAGKRPN